MLEQCKEVACLLLGPLFSLHVHAIIEAEVEAVKVLD